MENPKTKNVRGARARHLIRAASTNHPRTTQQSTSSTSSTSLPQRSATQYRVCTGETYQLAQLPTRTPIPSLKSSTRIQELSDRDTDLSDSSSSVQIDTPPDSTSSSGSYEHIFRSTADLEEPIQLFRHSISGWKISLIPIDSQGNKRQLDAASILGENLQHELLKMASIANNEVKIQIFQVLGLNDAWGLGPQFDNTLFSVFRKKFLELEIVAQSKSSGTEHKKYAVGFDTRQFSRTDPDRVNGHEDKINNETNASNRIRIYPYRATATQEVFQRYVDQMILPRKQAWTEICERLHEDSAAQIEPGPEFRQVAATFFGLAKDGVPKDFPPDFIGNTKCFQITKGSGDRTKVLDAKPLEDDTLVIFLEDCLMSSELNKAVRHKSLFYGMTISKDVHYSAMANIEESTQRLEGISSDDALPNDEAFKEQFTETDSLIAQYAIANSFKKLLDQVPGAVENILDSGLASSQTRDVAKDKEISGPNALGISGLDGTNAAAPKTSATQQVKDRNSTGCDATGTEGATAANGKSKKKKSKSKKKKSAVQPQPAEEDPNAQESTFDDSGTLGDVAKTCFEDKSVTKEVLRSKITALKDVSPALVNHLGSAVEDSGMVVEIIDGQGWTDVECNKKKATGISRKANTQRNPSNNTALPAKKTFDGVVRTPPKPGLPRNVTSFSKMTKSPRKLYPSTKADNTATVHASAQPKHASPRNSPLASSTSKSQTKIHPSTEGNHISSIDDKTSNEKLLSLNCYNEAFPPLLPNRMGEKKLSNDQQPDSARGQAKVEDGERQVTGANSKPVAATDASSHPSQINKGKVKADTPQGQHDVTTSSFVTSAAVPDRSSNNSEPIRQQSPLAVTSQVHTVASSNPQVTPDKSSKKPSNNNRKNNKPANSQSRGAPSGIQSGVGATTTAGQHSSLALRTSSATSTTAKGEISNTQNQPSALPNEIHCVESEEPLASESAESTEPAGPTQQIVTEPEPDASQEDGLTKLGGLSGGSVIATVTNGPLSETNADNHTAEEVRSSTPLGIGMAPKLSAVQEETENSEVAEIIQPVSCNAGTRSHSEEAKNRVPSDSAELLSLTPVVNQSDNNHGDSEGFVTDAVGSTSGEQPQPDGGSAPSYGASSPLSFPNTEQAKPERPSNMMPPLGPPHSNHGNTYAYRGPFLNPAVSRYENGLGNRMPTADTHAHPLATPTFQGGNSDYSSPSNRDPALKDAQRGARSSLQDWNCTFCKVTFHPTPEHPASFCPFCLNHGIITYCSTSCQLADSHDHCAHCQHWPSYERIYRPLFAPNTTSRVENYPLKGMSNDLVTPECYRQKAFSMFCRTGQFPDIMGSWRRFKQNGRIEVGIPDSRKYVGDYFVFRSGLTSKSLSQAPVDVICTITLDPRDAMKLPLRRVLNACYVQPVQPFTRFLFRLLHYLIADYNVFNLMISATAYASQAEIADEFIHQFSREFSFPAAAQTGERNFSFLHEWQVVEPYLEQLEQEHAILRYWKTRDTKYQKWWPKSWDDSM